MSCVAGQRARDAALDLRRLDARGQHRERLGRLVARLHLDRGPVDRRAVEPRRRAGLEPAEREAEPLERERQAERRRLADPAGRRLLLADMDQAAQERAGGQHDGAAANLAAVARAARRRPGRRAISRSSTSPSITVEVRGLADRPLHRCGVELAVGLRARPAHRRSLAAVEHAELDAALVGDPAHQAVERIDLAHQMALAEPADRRIAGHRADGREPVRDQRRARAHARSRSRSLAAGMAAADHDDIEGSHGIHPQACTQVQDLEQDFDAFG